jgi:pimeloyl-ACP methyl ester carboxylesterase
MVLDAVVDGTLGLELIDVPQVVGFSETMDHFYQWAGNNQTSALHGQDVGPMLKSLLNRLEKTPYHSAACAQSGKCYPTVSKWSMLGQIGSSIQHEPEWPAMAKSIAAAVQGNFTAWLSATSTSETSQSFSYQLGCLDYYSNETYDQWANRREAEVALSGYDYNGPSMAASRFLQCPKWPAPIVNPPKPLDIANTSAPVLLVNALWDPACPYDGAVHVQRQIGGSVLLTRNGSGHGSWVITSHGEAQDIMVNYFVTGKVPKAGTIVNS